MNRYNTITPVPPLPERMLQRADRDMLPEDHEIRTLARELNRLIELQAGAATLVPAWARARLAWKAYTKEPLV